LTIGELFLCILASGFILVAVEIEKFIKNNYFSLGNNKSSRK
jgi:hypothetical protein